MRRLLPSTSNFPLNCHTTSFNWMTLITMAKKNFAHLSLNTYLEAVCKVNYRKSVTIRKIFKNSLKLDQAECCNIICLKMTTKWSQLLCFPQSEFIDHQNFPLSPMYQCKNWSKSNKIHEEKKIWKIFFKMAPSRNL